MDTGAAGAAAGESGAAASGASLPGAPAPAFPGATHPASLDALQFELDNIFVAAGDGELAKVQAFVAGGVSVNSQDEYGYTPLHAACSYGCVAVAQWLLAQGATAGIRDEDGDTPLHHCEDARCADLLLAAGADLVAVNSAGHCAYLVAAWERREAMLEWFAQAYHARGLELPPVPPNPEEGEGESMDYVEEEEAEEGGAGGRGAPPGVPLPPASLSAPAGGGSGADAMES